MLTFEVEPDHNGKRSAVRVHRPGDAQRDAAPRRPVRLSTSGRDHSSGLFGKVIRGLLVCALLWFGYSQYAKRSARFESALPAPPASLSPVKLSVPPDFKCDGRNMCSQMTSCREAALFLQNCPGMKLDGNGDGVPCEQQWCTNRAIALVEYAQRATKNVANPTSIRRVRHAPLQSKWAVRSGQYSRPCPR